MNKELLTALLTALTKASKIYPQPNLNDPATREGIARILLDEIEKKGVIKELANRDPNQLHEDMSSTVMDALRIMMEEIKKTRETVVEQSENVVNELKQDHRDMAEALGKGMKTIIRGQTRIAETVIDVVRQEGQYTREKINEAKEEMDKKMSDHFYYANRLHP